MDSRKILSWLGIFIVAILVFVVVFVLMSFNIKKLGKNSHSHPAQVHSAIEKIDFKGYNAPANVTVY